MAEKSELLSARAIAKELGVSKAIKTLNLQPDSKKGACSYLLENSIEKTILDKCVEVFSETKDK